MARNETVNIDNLDDLMSAFDNIKCPNWGLFSGTALLTSYEGNNQQEARALLEDSAELFCGRSAGRYTLVIYRGLKTGEMINNKTPYNNSINFRLHHDQRSAIGEAGYSERYGDRDTGKALQKLYEENARLKVEVERAKLTQAKPAEETWADKMGGVIDALGLTDIMPDLARGIIGKFAPGIPMKLAGPTGGAAAAESNTTPVADPASFNDSINILNETVPDLPFIMSQLAKLSKEKPDQFQFYINAIRKM